jgi:predicted amino acid dehydrogenase
MFALVLAMGLARSTLKRLYAAADAAAAARIEVKGVTVLCSLPAVVEAINHRRARGTTESLESVGSKEDRAMLRRVLESVRRLARYGVQVSVVGCGAEGNTADAVRVEMIARHRKKKVCRRRRHERRIRSANTETAGDEREDGGGDEEERGGADDRGEGRSDGLHWGRGTERESSSAFVMVETGEPRVTLT